MTDTPAIQPELVADYLTRHPNFFNDFPALLADIHVPHPHGTHAVSMGERQLISIREKVRLLENKLAELIQFGEENDSISEKLHAMTLALLAASTPGAVVAALNLHLRDGFAVPHYAIRVWNLVDSEQPITQPIAQNVRDAVGAMSFPVCGALAVPEAREWFGEIASHLRSFAAIPLSHQGNLGLLVLASEEPNRFYATMGTLYLTRLGQVVAAALHRMQV
ncbi:MAG: DUF484 family protein [Thiobacillus sp.]